MFYYFKKASISKYVQKVNIADFTDTNSYFL